MKIALVSNAENSAVDQVLSDLRHGLFLIYPEWNVDLIRYEERDPSDLGLDTYDIVHMGYIGYGLGADLPCPVTAGVWHIRPDRLEHHRGLLTQLGYARLVVDDVMTLQLLGQIGFTNVSPISMAFDPARYLPLPVPDAPFTVGCFGDGFLPKRFDVIERACREAEVECYMMVLPVGRKAFSLDPVEDVYAQVHALAHASFVDTNCRPGLEALACGRPLLSTINDGLRRILNAGNITFYDGSVGDLAQNIKLVREHYELHRSAALATPFPSLELIARKYAYMWERLLEQES